MQQNLALEEAVIREKVTGTMQNRVSAPIQPPPAQKSKGPPVTFMNPTKEGAGASPSTPTEESKADASQAVEGMNENNFDVVESPMRRGGSVYVSSKDKTPIQAAVEMVPLEQYNALKQKFIENESTTKERLESITDLEKTIQRREEQMQGMERSYLQKLEDAKLELESFKELSRDIERKLQTELEEARVEKQ